MLKQALLTFLVLAAPAVQAQCTITHLGLDPVTQPAILHGLDLDDGGMIAVLKQRSPWSTSRTIILSRTDGAGTPIWQKRVTNTNPGIQMDPRGILKTQDGGYLVHGDLLHGQGIMYHNQFALKLNEDGTVEWARIYMVPGPEYWGCLSGGRSAVVELSEGGYAYAVQNVATTSLFRLDAMGMPVSARSYWPHLEPETSQPQTLRAVLGADGSLYVCHQTFDGATMINSLDVFKVDPDGQVEWATHVADAPIAESLFQRMGSLWPASLRSLMVLAGNGDVVIAGVSQELETEILRLSSTGDFLWKDRIGVGGSYSPVSLMETPNGDLLAGIDNYLVHVQGDGNGPTMAWQRTQAYRIQEMEAGNGQLAIGCDDPTFHLSELVLATDTDQFATSCDLEAYGALNLAQFTCATSPVVIDSDIATIKSWTMSIGDPSGLGLDLYTACQIPTSPRPGFLSQVMGAVINGSGTACTGPMTITCELPALLTLSNIAPPPSSVVGNVITWTVADGLPADGYWSFTAFIQPPPDPALIGTTITMVMNVAHDDPEADLSNNASTASALIVGAYDPNDKLVCTSSGMSEASYFSDVDHWLDYTVRFQNTGTFAAENVVITDTLPAELPVGGFVPLSSTHPYTYALGGDGILRFTFSGIQLPDSNTNEPLSHGAVSFRIRPRPGLVPGTVITNRADIFFDFNPPVRTPDASITVDLSTSIAEISGTPVLVFPVPARERIVVQMRPSSGANTVRVLALDGRLVHTEGLVAKDGRMEIDVRALSAGAYVLSIEDATGHRSSGRFTKE